jgi:flagellar protein FlaF
MSLQAYKKAAAAAEDPRSVEYRLFGEVTRALMEADKADALDFKTRMDALDWNRRLWSTLATDCSMPDNKLAPSLRAQIISLSLFVSRHTSLVMRREDDMEVLIEINRIIMQGLAPQSAPAASAA